MEFDPTGLGQFLLEIEEHCSLLSTERRLAPVIDSLSVRIFKLNADQYLLRIGYLYCEPVFAHLRHRVEKSAKDFHQSLGERITEVLSRATSFRGLLLSLLVGLL